MNEETAKTFVIVLSPREREVLRMMADGMTQKEIGGILGICEKTVAYYRGRVNEKLKDRGFKNMNSIAMLTRLAVKAGLVALCLFGVARIAAAQTTMLFSWDNPGSQYSNLVWNIYWTANIAAPTNTWPLLKSEPSPTNVTPTRLGTFVQWTNPPGAYFFTATWSNTFWKTNSFFSAVAVSPALPPTTQPFNFNLQAP